jgi:hypothetical protein
MKDVFRGLFIFFLAVLVICFAIFIYQKTKSFTTTDFDFYLRNGTYFEESASLILPSKDALENAQILTYEYDYQYGVFFGGEKMLRLSAVYSEEDFFEAQNAIEEKYLQVEGLDLEKVCLNEELYHCYVFYNNSSNSVNAYAMAYNIDAEERKISYILYESFDVQIMSASSALSLYYSNNKISTTP